jgi:hypothetical protein
VPGQRFAGFLGRLLFGFRGLNPWDFGFHTVRWLKALERLRSLVSRTVVGCAKAIGRKRRIALEI